ncbi:hypothetical protein TNIN_179431 [Trichonephila inaurata madagascariensis]|uniref:RING-type domain-containing protein n=1 Tax=Trichonephila inaurata madagascariensis TaxID=2747483 RepID=A0A8X6YC78_9ARAC|nr:hypothetical protein TNIN_179431 [Trichonephila inaurata madagascariensis]
MMQSENSDSLSSAPCKEGGHDSTECSICLNCNNSEWYILSQCKHTFHLICLREWLENAKSTCPYCRGKVLKNDKISIGCGAHRLELLRRIDGPEVTLEDLFTDTESDSENDFYFDTDISVHEVVLDFMPNTMDQLIQDYVRMNH